MAVYKLNSSKQKSRSAKARKITGFTMIGVSSVVFLLMTGIIPALQKFFLGLFGVFGFLLCVIMIVIGLAVLNSRRYVMPKRYAICLILSVVFVLCLLQLMIVGNKYNPDNSAMTYWQYWALNYTKTWTAGGFLIGFLTTTFIYIANLVGAYLIFALGLVISVALMVDSLTRMKKQGVENDGVSVQIKEVGQRKEPTITMPAVKEEREEVNVVLDGSRKEENMPAPPTAKQILGLDHKRNYAYEYQQESNNYQTYNKPVEEKKPEKIEPKNLREYILTPPEVDIDEYFKDVDKRNNVPQEDEINENVEQLKNEQTDRPVFEGYSQNQVWKEQNQLYVQNPQNEERSIESVKSDELVEKADDILRSAIEEEKAENPDIFEDVDEEISAEENVINNLPDRDNSGNFSRDSFDRMSRDSVSSNEQNGNSDRSFDRSDRASFDRGDRNLDRRFFDRRDRNLSQEDKDAQNEYRQNLDTISARNGMLSRENQPIEPEKEEEPYVPYNYTKPSIDLITTKSVDLSALSGEVEQKRVALENALETFGVPAKVKNVVVGPAVTRYELEMPQGISVAKIKNHDDDIAYALAAEGAIRVEAPVPGKSVVGIEVPNASIATVSLRDVLDSNEFKNATSPLTFAIGKDISGKVVCANMQKLTHLLVAGTTGSGKSVCLNSIILSIIYKASPEEVKIVLVDPKRVEFANYEALPHLIMPKVICDTQKAISTLAWLVDEMERRFEIMRLARVRNIDEFNQTPDVVSQKVRKMPFIVVIVDELADLMMTGKKEVEEKIVRLAQKARACGIHLILATQRPSVDVVTGLIKSNFPSRISFSVASATDSMVILDRVGAEKLLGKGDMLYFPNGAKDPVRMQGCFIGTNEINNIVDFTKDNNEPIFDKEIEAKINNPNRPSEGGAENHANEMDPLLPQVLKASIDAKVASATMIRRRFAIGYPRAARIIDQMEEAGYISSADGVKPRTVYITEEEFNQIFGDVE